MAKWSKKPSASSRRWLRKPNGFGSRWSGKPVTSGACSRATINLRAGTMSGDREKAAVVRR